MCDHVRCHESPPFQDVSSFAWLRRSVPDLTDSKRGLTSDLSLPGILHARVAESTSEQLPPGSMVVRILHGEDSKLTGGSELCVEVRLQKAGADFVDLGDARNVRNGDLVWCNSNNIAIFLVEGVHVEDPSP